MFQAIPLLDGAEDGQLTQSSSWDDRWHVRHSRLLNPDGSWHAAAGDDRPSITFDARALVLITAIEMRGRHDADYEEWVTKYRLQYSLDGVRWVVVTRRGRSGADMDVFTGNWDRQSVAHNACFEPFVARFVKLMPVRWVGYNTPLCAGRFSGYQQSAQRRPWRR
jgi:hypothetical protein